MSKYAADILGVLETLVGPRLFCGIPGMDWAAAMQSPDCDAVWECFGFGDRLSVTATDVLRVGFVTLLVHSIKYKTHVAELQVLLFAIGRTANNLVLRSILKHENIIAWYPRYVTAALPDAPHWDYVRTQLHNLLYDHQNLVRLVRSPGSAYARLEVQKESLWD